MHPSSGQERSHRILANPSRPLENQKRRLANRSHHTAPSLATVLWLQTSKYLSFVSLDQSSQRSQRCCLIMHSSSFQDALISPTLSSQPFAFEKPCASCQQHEWEASCLAVLYSVYLFQLVPFRPVWICSCVAMMDFSSLRILLPSCSQAMLQVAIEQSLPTPHSRSPQLFGIALASSELQTTSCGRQVQEVSDKPHYNFQVHIWHQKGLLSAGHCKHHLTSCKTTWKQAS